LGAALATFSLSVGLINTEYKPPAEKIFLAKKDVNIIMVMKIKLTEL
jgi:hypothetical protein